MRFSITMQMEFFNFLGPSFLVAVTYIDPGNYSTDIAGGVNYKYKLLVTILGASLLSVILQNLSSKIGIVTRKDLACNCRIHFPKWVSLSLWFFIEIAIISTDLAEVIGSAIALNLLFGLPILAGVLITSADILIILLFFKDKVVKYFEWLTGIFVVGVGICFSILLEKSKPEFKEVLLGYVPSSFTVDEMIIALGILGATVMPHSLFLHSNLVLKTEKSSTRKQLQWSFWATNLALFFAFYVNSSILIVAGSSFFQKEVADLQGAYSVISDTLGKFAASTFALALLFSGQTSSFIGTLAGQIVFEGFIELRISPAVRHGITRLLSIIPAVIFVSVFGQSKINNLLIYSQIVLSSLLPFAVIPLVVLSCNKRVMGDHSLGKIKMFIYGFVCIALIFIDGFLIYSFIVQ